MTAPDFVGGLCALVLGTGFIFLVWRREVGKRLVFAPLLIFSINEAVRNWVAAFLGPSLGISARMYPLYLMVLAFAFFATASLILLGRTRWRSSEWGAASEVEDAPFGGELAVTVWMLTVTAVLTVAGLYLYRGVPPTVQAFASVFRGSFDLDTAMGVTQQREALTKSYFFGGGYAGQGAIRAISGILWPLALGVCVASFTIFRRRKWMIASLVVGVAAVSFVGGDGTRGPLLWMFVYVLVMLSFVRPLQRRSVIIGLAALVILVAGSSVLSLKLYRALESGQLVSGAIETVASRVAIDNGRSTLGIVDLVDSGRWEYRLGGLHLDRLKNALPGVQGREVFANVLFLALNPTASSRRTTYSTATYFGEVYLDFGPVGAIAVYSLLGFSLAAISVSIARRRRTAEGLAFLAMVSLVLGRIPLSGTVGAAVSLAILLVAYWWLVIIRRVIQVVSRFRPGRHFHFSP